MVIILLLLLMRIVPVCPAEGWVTSEYGYREDPITHRRRFHAGVDVAAQSGTPIRAPWAGTVVRAARARYSGRFIVVQSGDIRLTFMHLQAFSVAAGDQVAKGDQLGLMGSSGRATGPHVHLEMRYQGKRRDPALTLLRCPRLQ